MATKKITELPELSNPTPDDVVMLDSVENGQFKSKKFKLLSLLGLTKTIFGESITGTGDIDAPLTGDSYVRRMGNWVRNITDVSELTDNTGVLFDGDYDSLENQPTKLSDFENDQGFLDKLVISDTAVNEGTNGGLFFNDNGVFNEMNGIKFDNSEGLFYNENFDDGGLKMSNIEITYMGNTLSLPSVGIYGFPDSSDRPYFNGIADGSQYGLGQRSTTGWIDLLTGNGTYIQVKAENDVSINAENNVNINADVNVNINADVNVNINADVNVNINAESNVTIDAEQILIDIKQKFGGNDNFTIRDDSGNNLFEVHRTGLTKVVSNQFQLGNNSYFGQQLSTGQSATVDDVITALQSMGILTQ